MTMLDSEKVKKRLEYELGWYLPSIRQEFRKGIMQAISVIEEMEKEG